MYLILLVSMYFLRKSGNTSRYQWPHTGQATEAYSTTVTLAFGLPRNMSSGRAAVEAWLPPQAASAGVSISPPMRAVRLLRVRADILFALRAAWNCTG